MKVTTNPGWVSAIDTEYWSTVVTVCKRGATTVTYLAFAFVFFYFGLQKPAPVDSPVRLPIAAFASQVSHLLSGLPGVEMQISTQQAVLFVGGYEMVLGLLFLVCLFTPVALRLVFWLFLSHQAVGFLSLILLRKTVFQPPWITVAGFDIPWALGSFSAFVLKNLVFIGAFMLLVSAELEPHSPSDRQSTTLPNPVWSTLGWVNKIQDSIVMRVFDRWAKTVTLLSFAFVFFYFGLQKPAPVVSPVRTPIGVFLDELETVLSVLLWTEVTIPLRAALVFIGFYEMFLGLLFLFCLFAPSLIRTVFWLFAVHQTIGFLSLVLTWKSTFIPPWITVAGFSVPWALGSFSAFVLKNLVFVGAFMLLIFYQFGDEIRITERRTRAERAQSMRDGQTGEKQ